MISKTRLLPLLVLVLLPVITFAQDAVISDDGVAISRAELEHIMEGWTPQMRRAAANDVGDRLELLNIALVKKKMAARADRIRPKTDPEAYWRYQLEVQGAKRRFLMKQFIADMTFPDMTELAKERYQTEKEKYARVPERRLSSHILFMCVAGKCDRDELRPKAQAVLDELRAGADFNEMVTQHSDDPGSKSKNGLFNKWMKLGEAGVEPSYTGGVFSIAEKGEYSDLVDSRYGLHIIRLDDVKESNYLPYEQVKDKILADLQAEYRELALKDFEAQFRMTDKAYIDGDAMDELFKPYQTK